MELLKKIGAYNISASSNENKLRRICIWISPNGFEHYHSHVANVDLAETIVRNVIYRRIPAKHPTYKHYSDYLYSHIRVSRDPQYISDLRRLIKNKKVKKKVRTFLDGRNEYEGEAS